MNNSTHLSDTTRSVEQALVSFRQTDTVLSSQALAENLPTGQLSFSYAVQVAAVSLHAYDTLLETYKPTLL